jgi:predicted N-acetyltransferase YhbS
VLRKQSLTMFEKNIKAIRALPTLPPFRHIICTTSEGCMLDPESTTGHIEIRELARSEVEEAAWVVARAMGTNPGPLAVFGPPEQQALRRQVALFRFVLGRLSGRVLVAREGGRIVGVMRMTRSPYCRRSSPRNYLRLLPVFMPLVPSLIGAAPRMVRWLGLWARHHPREPHWHLGPLAVLPKRQGRGIGTRLLCRFCEDVDQAGDGAYLETDKPENVRLYERFSFTVTAQETLFGVVTWFMWRAPCSASGESPGSGPAGPADLDAHP